MFETIAVFLIVAGAVFLAARSVYKSLSTRDGCHGNCGHCKFPPPGDYPLNKRNPE